MSSTQIPGYPGSGYPGGGSVPDQPNTAEQPQTYPWLNPEWPEGGGTPSQQTTLPGYPQGGTPGEQPIPEQPGGQTPYPWLEPEWPTPQQQGGGSPFPWLNPGTYEDMNDPEIIYM